MEGTFFLQVNPISDHTMRIEWLKDGRPITASSRIGTIFSFGYVSLNITSLRADDSGTYVCRCVLKPDVSDVSHSTYCNAIEKSCKYTGRLVSFSRDLVSRFALNGDEQKQNLYVCIEFIKYLL